MAHYLDLDDLLRYAGELTEQDVLVRDYGLLEAALARPRASAFGQEVYPDLHVEAAALLHSLCVNHALVDGNKRLAWGACGRPPTGDALQAAQLCAVVGSRILARVAAAASPAHHDSGTVGGGRQNGAVCHHRKRMGESQPRCAGVAVMSLVSRYGSRAVNERESGS